MPEKRDILAEISAAAEEYRKLILDRYEAIGDAHRYSKDRLAGIREAIAAEQPPASCGIHVLAAAGSLARFEASEHSDLDLIVTTHPADASNGAPNADHTRAWRDGLCGRLKIERPNPNGVFQDPICRSSIEGISGDAKERYQDVAKRVLFILESEWLHGESEHGKLIDTVIDKYTQYVRDDPRKNFVFLLNDVVRFFRQLCVNYQYTTSETTDGKWPLRNIKLRHSRVIMYFSMIAAIGSLSRYYEKDKIEALKVLTKMPPLERLFVSYKISGDEGFYRVGGSYNTFLLLLSQKAVRDQLKDLDYEDRYKSPYFGQLKANSDGLSAELLRFYEARRGIWDDRFFEYMIL